MFLYNFELQSATAITAAVVGNFTGTKQQDIVVVRAGHTLELLRPDPATGRITSMLTTPSFGVIRSIVAFRLTGTNKGSTRMGTDLMLRLHCYRL
jgi:splicing factor 3B subunit 3